MFLVCRVVDIGVEDVVYFGGFGLIREFIVIGMMWYFDMDSLLCWVLFVDSINFYVLSSYFNDEGKSLRDL